MYKKILISFFVWRVFIFLCAFLSPVILGTFGNRFPYVEILKSYGLPHWVWAFGNFDGVHYLRIAQDGYAYQYTQAFFPLYPILVKIVSFITLGNYLIAALLVSNISFLIALIIFHKLLVKVYNHKIAFWSCIFLLTFPTSFYFGAVYTEGLFFLLIIASFYFAAQSKNWQAALVASCASATRIVGIFLSLLVILNNKRKLRFVYIFVPFGLISYMIYLHYKFNNAFYFLTAQTAFGQNRETARIILLPQVIYRWINQLLSTQGIVFANSAFELVATIFALTLLLIGIKTVKREWIIFSFLTIITPTLTGSLISMPRYILIAFPIYIVLAHIKSSIIKTMIALSFSVLLFITTIYFSQGYWVA